MASWVLVAWALQIRRELAAIAPGRDTRSDGSVGDAAHKLSTSGHNPDDTPGVRAERSDADNIPEVRAIDIDKDLRVPGLTMAMIIAYLVGRCRAGLERRLIYIIYDRTIWSATSGWVARRYTGSNPHTEHAHLSGHPDYDNDGRPFGLAAILGGDGVSVEDVTKGLERARPYQSKTVAQWAKDHGWGSTSQRALAEYTLVDVRGLRGLIDEIADQQEAVLKAVLGDDDAAKIVSEIRAQGEQTRAALIAQMREIAPGLAAAVVERLAPAAAAAEIGEAIAAEFAAMLAAAAGRATPPPAAESPA